MLTVGDGLVSQIPAIIVSIAAGMLVSKAGVTGSLDKAVLGQLSSYPTALGLVGFLMLGISILPGIPMVPFAMLGAITGGLARVGHPSEVCVGRHGQQIARCQKIRWSDNREVCELRRSHHRRRIDAVGLAAVTSGGPRQHQVVP